MLDASRARELILIFGFVGWGRAPPPSARSPSCERESEADKKLTTKAEEENFGSFAD
jgi:hypothetical protein